MKKSYVFAVLIVASLLFYWFQIRPLSIRKNCYTNTFGRVNQMIAQENFDRQWAEGKVWTWDYRKGAEAHNWGWFYPIPSNRSVTEQLYAECLVENGMKAERVLLP